MNGLTVKPNRSVLRRQESRYRPQRRRFSGTIATNQRDDLTLLHAQRTTPDRFDRAVVHGQIVNFQQ